MYSTCLFCHADLGANEVIEHFPIGRRLAYDAAKGRLWVVCRACERWNLTPLEERWEAIEECERLFRDTRLRVSTDNIGLARVRDGLELVRIGEPQRPEFAAWRYGDQFGRRRRQRILRVGLGLGAAGAVVGGALTIGHVAGLALGGSVFWIGKHVVSGARAAYQRTVRGSPTRVITRVPLPDGDLLHVQLRHLPWIFVAPGATADRWSLSVHEPEKKHNRKKPSAWYHSFEGDEAFRVAGMVLPAINWEGATPDEVRTATSLLDGEGTAGEFFARSMQRIKGAERLDELEPQRRLALEMAAHEESERRALEGELHVLEAAWKDAEEIAAIADDMFLPQSVTDFVEKHRPPHDEPDAR
jgi:hypothetical protein